MITVEMPITIRIIGKANIEALNGGVITDTSPAEVEIETAQGLDSIEVRGTQIIDETVLMTLYLSSEEAKKMAERFLMMAKHLEKIEKKWKK